MTGVQTCALPICFPVTIGVGHGKYLRENAGINLNYRNGKVNAYGNYSWNERRQENTNDIYRYFRTQNEMYHADGRRKSFSYNHSLKAGVDYFLSDKTTIGILVNGSSGKYVMNEGWEVKGNGVKVCIVFPRSVLRECVFKYSEIW